jgi:hypothetical protein
MTQPSPSSNTDCLYAEFREEVLQEWHIIWANVDLWKIIESYEPELTFWDMLANRIGRDMFIHAAHIGDIKVLDDLKGRLGVSHGVSDVSLASFTCPGWPWDYARHIRVVDWYAANICAPGPLILADAIGHGNTIVAEHLCTRYNLTPTKNHIRCAVQEGSLPALKWLHRRSDKQLQGAWDAGLFRESNSVEVLEWLFDHVHHPNFPTGNRYPFYWPRPFCTLVDSKRSMEVFDWFLRRFGLPVFSGDIAHAIRRGTLVQVKWLFEHACQKKEEHECLLAQQLVDIAEREHKDVVATWLRQHEQPEDAPATKRARVSEFDS